MTGLRNLIPLNCFCPRSIKWNDAANEPRIDATRQRWLVILREIDQRVDLCFNIPIELLDGFEFLLRPLLLSLPSPLSSSFPAVFNSSSPRANPSETCRATASFFTLQPSNSPHWSFGCGATLIWTPDQYSTGQSQILSSVHLSHLRNRISCTLATDIWELYCI